MFTARFSQINGDPAIAGTACIYDHLTLITIGSMVGVVR